ncbi:MAG: hypothetical protein ACRD15_09070, partial [Vicinamibacterales bacterium]
MAVRSVLASGVLLWTAASPAAAQDGRLDVRVTWGHTASAAADHRVAVTGSTGLEVRSVAPHLFEAGDRLQDGVAQTSAGKTDVDGLDLSLAYPLDT